MKIKKAKRPINEGKVVCIEEGRERRDKKRAKLVTRTIDIQAILDIQMKQLDEGRGCST
jgi:hypothetical protein